MIFNLGALLNSSVWNVFRLRDRIDMDPFYQREGDVWNLERKQLLIDTIINGFDVPKIYMHKFGSSASKQNEGLEYAVIDGKQRLSAIWDFILGKFGLSDEFSYVKQDGINAKGYTYSDLSREFPDIKTDFDAYHLSIVTIETDDIELIEDMFSRLNEAMPLNAAEKRNARPGPLPEAVRKICALPFFTAKVPFTNKRYRHFDLAAKMLFLSSRDLVADTKKAYIDKFFELHRESSDVAVEKYFAKACASIGAMAAVFVDRDPLIRSAGMIILYFSLFERAIDSNNTSVITRPLLEKFEELRKENRLKAEKDIASADYKLLEFDRYTQSPNDAVAMRFRLAVIDGLLFGGKFGFDFPE